MCNSKTIQIFPNQYVDLLRFLFTEDALKIKKGLELVYKQNFHRFFDKNLPFAILHKLANFINSVFTSQVIQ